MYNDYTYKFLPEEIIEYLRKSRSDDPHLTVEEVLERHAGILSEWSEKNLEGQIPSDNIYREVVSGEQIDNRPEMQKILKRIESPKIKAILVVEPQRLSRGDLEDCGRLMKLLRYTDTKVITPTKIYDLSDEYDRDGFERELKRGNEYLEYFKKIQKRGTIASVKDGNYVGSVAPYGYRKITVMDGKKKCPTLEIIPEEAEVVRMIYDMFVNQNIGLVTIGHKLDEMKIKAPKGEHWSYLTMRDMLQNPHYLGKIKWNWRKEVRTVKDQELVITRPKNKPSNDDYMLVDGKHEAIIDEAMFNLAVKKLGSDPRKKFNTELKNPFAGVLFCRCGKPMSLRNYKDKKGNVRCQPRLLCNGQVHCKSGSVIAQQVLDAVVQTLEEQIEDFKVSMNGADEREQKRKEDTIAILKRRLLELEQKEISLWDKYTEEGMPKQVFDKLKAKVTQDMADVTLALAEEAKNEVVNYEDKISTFSDALTALKNEDVSAADKNKFLKVCIDRITVSRDKPELVAFNEWSDGGTEITVKLKI